MRIFWEFIIAFILIILFIRTGLISCRKEAKETSTYVELINPSENTLISLPDTVQVTFRIEGDLEITSASVSFVNVNYIPLFATKYIDSPNTQEVISTTLVLKSLPTISETPYYILISVYHKEGKENSYFNIRLENRPITYQGFFLFSRPGIHQTQIDFYDQNLNDTSFLQSEGEYIDSDIASFYGKLFLLSHTPEKLKTYFIIDNQLDWETQPTFPNPEFTDIETDENQIFAGMGNGQIVGYSQFNGQPELVAELLQDSIPQRIHILENYIVGDYLSRINGNKSLVTFYKSTGVKKHRHPIDILIVSFFDTDNADEIIVVGNQDQKGIVSVYNVQENYFENVQQLQKGEIVSACRIEANIFMYSVEDRLYLHNLKQNISSQIKQFGDYPVSIYFESLNQRIYVLFENKLSILQYPGMNDIFGLNFVSPLKGLQFYYAYD